MRSLQSPSLYVSSTMALPSALQLPLIQRLESVVARHVFVLKLPLSTHFVHAASVQSISSIDCHCVALPAARTVVLAELRSDVATKVTERILEVEAVQHAWDQSDTDSISTKKTIGECDF